ncbi:hypothetical protein ABIF65_010174 [Bradyrhizobium japonicum]|nr:hypothetical protein [Bradyrhizobium japonicum]MCP1783631.1 hypothetical protein [Bradyrhizobium japonicum]MCP1866114.1 hypothetical protein [Bradyrhizobium japonicum]MCP1896696.1 hypothetical protein [Bradyrhizobium japonicum]MCP1964081.1 hypothetical protein [Bradyrhizobium japonicum]
MISKAQVTALAAGDGGWARAPIAAVRPARRAFVEPNFLLLLLANDLSQRRPHQPKSRRLTLMMKPAGAPM